MEIVVLWRRQSDAKPEEADDGLSPLQDGRLLA
jgi:hypothetical protein